jgi:tetratricopeptide (TPR) repeat protein
MPLPAILLPALLASAMLAPTAAGSALFSRQMGESRTILPVTAEPEDQAAALDRLFESLKDASSPEIARGIEQLIWSIWLEAGGEEADQLMSLAILSMHEQEFEAARSYLDRIIALEPDFAEGWNKRATVYFLEGDYERSLEDIREVLALEPRHFGALSGLGMIFERIGRKEEALEAFRRALEIHPQMPAVQQRVEELSQEVDGVEL